MPKFSGRLMRYISVLALVAMLQVLVPAPVTVADGDGHGGRNVARCKLICTVIKLICNFRCYITCRNMFPGSSSQQSACRNQCNAICDDDRAECNAKCDAIEPPPSPDDPDDDDDGHHGGGGHDDDDDN